MFDTPLPFTYTNTETLIFLPDSPCPESDGWIDTNSTRSSSTLYHPPNLLIPMMQPMYRAKSSLLARRRDRYWDLSLQLPFSQAVNTTQLDNLHQPRPERWYERVSFPLRADEFLLQNCLPSSETSTACSVTLVPMESSPDPIYKTSLPRSLESIMATTLEDCEYTLDLGPQLQSPLYFKPTHTLEPQIATPSTVSEGTDTESQSSNALLVVRLVTLSVLIFIFVVILAATV